MPTPPLSDRPPVPERDTGDAHPSIPLQDVVSALNAELRIAEIPDYPGAMNGLQVGNRGSVQRVAVAVDVTCAGASPWSPRTR